MNIGTITCSYFMRIYGYKKPEDFDWGAMTAKYRAEFKKQDFLKLAGEIRALGYDGIEIWEPTFSYLEYSPAQAEALRKELADMGFRLVVYCIGGWSAKDVEAVEPAYRFAKALGARVVTGCIVEADAPVILPVLEKWGKALGLKYAIENHPAPNFENPKAVAAAIADYETVGANLDSGIYNMQGYDVLEAADLFGEKIYHVHFKDTLKGGSGCKPVGEGDAPMGVLLLKLRDRGYSEMVSVEFEYEGDPAPGLGTSIAFINRTLGR